MNSKSFYIWFGAPIVAVVIWVFTVYMPLSSSIEKKESELAEIKKDRQQLELSIQGISHDVEIQEKLRQAYDAFMVHAPVLEKMPQYIKHALGVAKTRGVTVSSLHGYYTSLDKGQKPGLMYPVFEVGLRGDFLDMGAFLEELSGKVGFKGVSAAKISCDEKDYPAVEGKFVLEFKALKEKKGEGK